MPRPGPKDVDDPREKEPCGKGIAYILHILTIVVPDIRVIYELKTFTGNNCLVLSFYQENSDQSKESSSVKARIQNMQSNVGANQKRDQWDSAINTIMTEDKPAPTTNKVSSLFFSFHKRKS